MEFLTVVLWVGILWILAVCCWSWWMGRWTLEPFAMQMPVQERTKPTWIRTPMDAQARKGHSCRVMESFADPELSGTTIEIVESTCEEGLPHTSNDTTIRIPEPVWNSPRRDNVLRHERVHILQRRNPAAWADFYKTAWQYTLHTQPPAGMPDADRIRGNPDTDPPFACWSNRYWFVPLYGDTPRLADAEVRVWDAQAKQWVDPPAAWRSLFCGEQCPHQLEHPAEISAEYWTDIDDWTTPASVALRNFILSLK